MKIYNVIWKHDGIFTTAKPFLNIDAAIKWSIKIANQYCDKSGVVEIGPYDFLFYIQYSVNGNCLYITEHEIEE